jgi:hypothetical protein
VSGRRLLFGSDLAKLARAENDRHPDRLCSRHQHARSLGVNGLTTSTRNFAIPLVTCHVSLLIPPLRALSKRVSPKLFKSLLHAIISVSWSGEMH